MSPGRRLPYLYHHISYLMQQLHRSVRQYLHPDRQTEIRKIQCPKHHRSMKQPLLHYGYLEVHHTPPALAAAHKAAGYMADYHRHPDYTADLHRAVDYTVDSHTDYDCTAGRHRAVDYCKTADFHRDPGYIADPRNFDYLPRYFSSPDLFYFTNLKTQNALFRAFCNPSFL